MAYSDYLGSSSVRLNVLLKTRRKVLEMLAEILGDGCNDVSVQEIFFGLLEREKLGSTALGSGLAVPHCRLDKLRKPMAAVLGAAKGIDYDAPDRRPVKLFFSLLIPSHSKDEHLHILAGLAMRFQNDRCVRALMKSRDHMQIVHALNHSRL